MLKAYVSRGKIREKPEEHRIDYWFCSRAQDRGLLVYTTGS